MPDNEKVVDSLVTGIVSKCEDWSQARDNDHKSDWEYAWRIWYGQHSEKDKERQSERSKYISPDTQSAIEAAGAEIEEALFGRESWVDMGEANLTTVVSDDMADQTGNFSEAILLGAIYGTGIIKSVIKGSSLHPKQTVVAIDAPSFILEPGAMNVDEAYGCAHEVLISRHLIDQGIADGIYRNVTLEPWADTIPSPDPTKSRLHVDTDEIHIYEWHGLAPARDVKRWARNRQVPEGIGDDKLVEAIITIANKAEVLRAEYNPGARALAAFQFERNPKNFWGRGIPHRTKWPQRGIDTEMRARQDSLAFSTFPMTLASAQAVPRNADFSIRPGRMFVVNSGGPVRDAMEVLKFPPPDPQTYAHTGELSKKLEVASGQMMNGVSLGEGDISRTGSGVASMFMGSQIRRISRTIRNIEDQMMVPFLRGYVERMARINPNKYQMPPDGAKIKVLSGLGIMAREFEVTQLTQVLAMIPDGPVKLLLARVILENSPMIEKAQVMSLVNFSIEQELTQKEEPPTPADEVAVARLEFEHQSLQANTQIKMAEIQQRDKEAMMMHERELVRIATEQDRIESDAVERDSKALLNIAKAEGEEVGRQLELYRDELELLREDNSERSAPVDDVAINASGSDIDDSSDSVGGGNRGVEALLQEVLAAVSALSQPKGKQGLKIERDAQGLIQSVNGRRASRNEQGLIVGIE